MTDLELKAQQIIEQAFLRMNHHAITKLSDASACLGDVYFILAPLANELNSALDAATTLKKTTS